MPESSLQRRIWMALSRTGLRLFRNQVGLAYQGKAQRFTQRASVVVMPGDVIIRQARTLRCGLCTGSSDLIGWRSIVIEPHHVGRVIAQFVGVEVKTDEGQERVEQATFRGVVKQAGGVAIVARSEEQAANELREA